MVVFPLYVTEWWYFSNPAALLDTLQVNIATKGSGLKLKIKMFEALQLGPDVSERSHSSALKATGNNEHDNSQALHWIFVNSRASSLKTLSLAVDGMLWTLVVLRETVLTCFTVSI